MEPIHFVIIIGAVIVLLIVIIALQPSQFRIERSAPMAAPAADVFVQVNDFHNWDGWSPWAKIDPAMKQTYEGASAGTGAIYTWSGNSKAGQGRMTITESVSSEVIRIKLEFMKPFKATNAAEFAFKTEGEKTIVTWSMSGSKNFVLKAFGLLMNMDKMIGGDFEKGLAQMRSIVETKKTV
jgi:hypothetical protein